MKKIIKTYKEINLIKKSANLVSKTLGMLSKEIKPGVNTLYLDHLAEEFIRDHNAIPAFLGLYNFPNTICVSPNEVVVHGIPNKQALKDGDIVSIDCGALINGYYGEHAYTFEVGNISERKKKLLKISKKSLYKGIEQCKTGNHIGDIGFAIDNYIKKYGYNTVKNLVGHGLGKAIHEDPLIPNFGKKGTGKKIKEGFVLSIEPMVNEGTYKVFLQKDNFTFSTIDKKCSAHYEHNVAIINNSPFLLSTFKYIYKNLKISSKEEDYFKFKK